MNAKEKLREYKSILDQELKNYLSGKIREAGKISPYAKEMAEHITDLTLRGGKRIRAALMFYSYLAHGGKDKDNILKASMSMELSETYLLIHDDIIDNDSLRRGGMTINTSYRQIGENKYHDKCNTRNFGNSVALLAGNIAASMSNEILATSNFKPTDIQRAMLELNRTYIVENYGQMMDMLSQLRDDITKDDVILIHQLKTVPYTFDSPIKIGAILAGADDSELNKLEGYSVPLGTAFQIQDDILGMFGSEEKLGKPVISDLKEGKKTLLILQAMSKATPKQHETIVINLGNKRTTLNALRDVREVVVATGSLEYSKNLATRLVKKSIANLTELNLKGEGKEFMLEIADYMINREY